jgi:hypothetical protein
MTVSIKNSATIPAVPARVPVFDVVRAAWSTDDVVQLARREGLVGPVADRGLWHLVDDGHSVLEVFQASQSFRFGRRLDGNETTEASDKPLDQAQVREAADAWVRRFAPKGPQFDLSSVDEQEVLVAERGATEPRRLVTGARVNYTFTLGGQPLLGPGAKMQVMVSPAGEVLEAYRFWRDVQQSDEVVAITPDEALARFARSELFADLNDRNATAGVSRMRLGHLALPPSEPQAFLIPVYELRGVLSTELHAHYDFVSYVAATTIDQATAKGRRQSARSHPRLITA